MKVKFTALLTAILLSVSMSVMSQQTVKTLFAGTGTQTATNLSTYIVGIGDGIPQVQYYMGTSDTANASALQFKSKGTNVGPIAVTAIPQTTNCTCVGSTFASNDVVVLRKVSTDAYSRLVVWGSSATNVYFTGAHGAAVGDLLYKVETSGTITNGATTLTINAPSGCFNGDPFWPLLLCLNANSNASIHVVSGAFKAVK